MIADVEATIHIAAVRAIKMILRVKRLCDLGMSLLRWRLARRDGGRSRASANGRPIPDEAWSPPPSFPGRRAYPPCERDTRVRRQERDCGRRRPRCSGSVFV